jgi:hypothetical protein
METRKVSIQWLSLIQARIAHLYRGRFLIEDMTGSLVRNREVYFPNLAVGIGKPTYGGLGGVVVIMKKVSRQALLRHLMIPLMWDKDGSRKSHPMGLLRQPLIYFCGLKRRTGLFGLSMGYNTSRSKPKEESCPTRSPHLGIPRP